MARRWGFWTRGKLDILRDYLDAFTTATKNKASERLYLNLFAGDPENGEWRRPRSGPDSWMGGSSGN